MTRRTLPGSHPAMAPGCQVVITRGANKGSVGVVFACPRRRVWAVGVPGHDPEAWWVAPVQASRLAIDLTDRRTRAIVAWWLYQTAPSRPVAPDGWGACAWVAWVARCGQPMTPDEIDAFAGLCEVSP